MAHEKYERNDNARMGLYGFEVPGLRLVQQYLIHLIG